MTRDDVAECFDPGFLTICHHTLIALSELSWRARRLSRLITQQPARARGKILP